MKIFKTLKSIISAVISLTLIICLFAPSASAFSPESFSDAGSDYLAAYKFLKAVGAMDPAEETPASDSVVTRAHFVKLALHASNDAPKVLLSADEVFYDVDMNTKYENYIETAYRIGYISGSADGLFEPESPITLSQASKILCNILGYTPVAEANGGYPGGYLIAAQRADLLTGINLNDNDALDFQNAMILIYNAVHANLMQTVSYGETIDAKEFDGLTLLTERHKVDYVEGIIEANGYTDLYSQESDLEKDYVSVNSVTYYAGSSDAEDYIGYHVRMYYSTLEGAKREVLYTGLTDENTVIVANGKDISASGNDISVYTPDGDTKSIKLSPTVTCILNGKMAVMDYEDLMDVTKGEVCFISNNGDKTTDIIRITSYDTFCVQGVSEISGLVVTHDGTRIELDSESDDNTFEIEKNSASATLSDIKPDDIILLSEGKGSGRIHKKLLVSDKSVTGAVRELGEDTAVIDGVSYPVNGISIKDLKIGKTYKLMIDSFGNVCHAEFENDVVYGYLYGLAKSGMNAPQCRIFTENNRWVDLPFAGKLKLNGKTVIAEEAYAELKGEEDFRRLIRYNVNSDAELIMLETATKINVGSGDANGDGTDEELEAIEADTFRLSYSGSLRYRNRVGNFNGIFFVDTNVKVFVIPGDMDGDKFKVRSKSKLVNDRTYAVEAYDIDECLNCKVIVTEDSANTTLDSTSRFMLVKGTGQVLDKEGSAVPSVKGWWKGTDTTFSVRIGEGYVSADTLNSLKKGDIISFTYDDDGNIVYIRTYPADEKYYISGSLYAATTFVSGVVKDADSSLRHIKLEYSEGLHGGISYNAAVPVYIWDSANETFTKASPAEIVKGDTIIANMRYLVCQEIIVIR